MELNADGTRLENFKTGPNTVLIELTSKQGEVDTVHIELGWKQVDHY